MRVAAIHAAIEVQARRTAGRIAAPAAAAGHEPVAAEANAAPAAALADAAAAAAILRAPLHAGTYPAPFMHLARAEAARLNAMPRALASVSLAIVAERAERGTAQDLPARLIGPTGRQPRAAHPAAGTQRVAE